MLHKLQGQDWRKDERTNGDRSLYQNYILTFLNERRPTTKIGNSSGGGGWLLLTPSPNWKLDIGIS